MAIDFSNGGTSGFTRAPRVVNVGDTVSGCPVSGRSNPLMSISFTTSATAAVIIQGEIIRRRDGTGRCDTALYGPGYPHENGTTSNGVQILDRTLDYNDSGYNNEWDNACFRWMGYVNSGTHTFYLNSTTGGNCINLWGCGSNWGQMHALIFE